MLLRRVALVHHQRLNLRFLLPEPMGDSGDSPGFWEQPRLTL